jgi:uncharacterized integral membrane protein
MNLRRLALSLRSPTWRYNQAVIVGLRRLSTNLHSIRNFNQFRLKSVPLLYTGKKQPINGSDMSRSSTFRLLLVIAVLIAMLLLLAALLNAAQFSLALWQQLQTAPPWVKVLLGAVVVSLLGFAFWLIWRLLRPARKPVREAAVPLTEGGLLEHLEQAAETGVDVAAAKRELAELTRRGGWNHHRDTALPLGA